MTVRDLIANALLFLGVLAFAFTAAGLLLTHALNDQLHYLAPGTLIGSAAICAAVLFHEGFSQSGAKSILILLLLLVSNPILSHATARAGRIRKFKRLLPGPGEQIPGEQIDVVENNQ